MPLHLVLTPSEGSCSSELAPRSLADLGASLLRFSVTQVADGKTTAQLLCDRGASVTGGALDLSLPDITGGGRVDLLVEAFDSNQPMRLLASGGVSGINLKPRLKPLQVLLAATDRFSCTPGPLNTSRSFHGATLLPTGEVLLTGGLTAEPPSGSTATGNQLWLSNAVEVYNPRKGTFAKVSGALSAGRAMHTAVLLSAADSAGPFDILLAAGISGSASTPVVTVSSSGGDPLPIFPGSGASAATTSLLRFYPWTDPPQVQEMTASPQLKSRIFQAAATGGSSEVVLLGGMLSGSAGKLTTVDDFEVLPTSGSSAHIGAFPLKQARLGAMAAPLSATEVLLFGGNLGTAAADITSRSAEVITLGSAPAAAQAGFEASSLPTVASVAHGTLSAVSAGQLLLAGGLKVEAGKAVTVQTPVPLMLISRVGSLLRATSLSSSTYTPVAYHEATALWGGDVMLSGGLPAACATASPLCGSTAAFRYLQQGGALRKERPLGLPRMGHRATLLADGNLLITGGLHHDGTRLTTQRGVEIYGPVSVDRHGRGAGNIKNACP